MGAINALGLAKRTKAKILQASTSEIYGDPDIHPQPESYWGNVNTLGPRACYDEGKRCAETLFMNYHMQNNVRIKIARIFNTYGPRMHPNDGRVVSNFIVQALKGNDITVFGDGSHTRSFQYVSDLISGLIKLMATPDSFTGPVNIGNPIEVSVGDLAEKIIRMTGSKSKIVHMPLPADDPKQRRPDITLAKDALGWQPEVGLDEGLSKTIEYFRSTIK
jgi:UDP-glucuronate decarboxylase